MKHLPKFPEIKVIEKNSMQTVSWHEGSRREVIFLSTVHFDNNVETENNNSNGGIQITSKLIVDYNYNINLVDESDMTLNTIECLRKSLKWYNKYFLHMMDMSVLNSYYLYQEKTSKETTLSKFSLNLPIQLIHRFSGPRIQYTGYP